MNLWVNVDEHDGVPSQLRKDVTPPPHWRLDAIAALGRPHDMALSADAASVAFVLDMGDLSDIWAMTVAGTELRRLTTNRGPYAFWEDTPPAWSPDGDRVAFAAAGWIHLVAAAGGPPQRLAEAGSPLWLDSDHLLATVERDRVGRLCRVAVADPWPIPLSPADGSATSATVSSDGSRIAYVHSPADDRNRSDLRVVDLIDGSVDTIVSVPGHFVTSPAFAPDGSSIAFVCDRTGWKELYLLIDGTERPLTSEQADMSSLRWSADGSRILAVRTRAGRDDLVLVDAEFGEVSRVAAGGTWSSPSWTADGSVIAVHEDHRTAPGIVTVDPDGRLDRPFAAVPAAIAAAPHVTPEVVTYRSTDGLEIAGFLFRPPGAGRGKCPAVVYPHGGPTSHYGDEWDGHAQYFVDKGYAWFAVNFRGSTSYGRDFEHADHGDWGVGDAEDCLAAHDYLAGLDWIDRERIAIFGASYGSYLALASLARDPRHRFACGVAKYGDCDILTSWAQGDQPGVEDLERMMGHPSDNRAAYIEGSPVHMIANVARPILVAHGEQDERVSPEQSKELIAELKKHGKPYEYVTYPTEGHGLLRREPQIDFYRRLERFLDWYLM